MSDKKYLIVSIGMLILAGYFKLFDIFMTGIAMSRGYRELNILSYLTHNHFGIWVLINILGLFAMIIGLIISYRNKLFKEFSYIMLCVNIVSFIIFISCSYNLL